MSQGNANARRDLRFLDPGKDWESSHSEPSSSAGPDTGLLPGSVAGNCALSCSDASVHFDIQRQYIGSLS